MHGHGGGGGKGLGRTRGDGLPSPGRPEEEVASASGLVTGAASMRERSSAAARICASSAPCISRAAAAWRAGTGGARPMKLSEDGPRGVGEERGSRCSLAVREHAEGLGMPR